VPETLHIGAYPRTFTPETRGQADLEIPANRLDRGPLRAADLPNCHAEGRGFESISRFFANPLGGLVPALEPETKSNHPPISP